MLFQSIKFSEFIRRSPAAAISPTVMGRSPVKAASTQRLCLKRAKKREIRSTRRKGGRQTAKVAMKEPQDAAGSGITDISGAVDADGAGRHLGDGDDFGELGRGEPLMAIDDLMLNKGEHGITASEAEMPILV